MGIAKDRIPKRSLSTNILLRTNPGHRTQPKSDDDAKSIDERFIADPITVIGEAFYQRRRDVLCNCREQGNAEEQIKRAASCSNLASCLVPFAQWNSAVANSPRARNMPTWHEMLTCKPTLAFVLQYLRFPLEPGLVCQRVTTD
jgi:hypothetical protein